MVAKEKYLLAQTLNMTGFERFNCLTRIMIRNHFFHTFESCHEKIAFLCKSENNGTDQ